jgi:hypothetical protein
MTTNDPQIRVNDIFDRIFREHLGETVNRVTDKSQPVAFRLRNTAFRGTHYEYYSTLDRAEQRQSDFNRSVDDGGLHDLTPLYEGPVPELIALAVQYASECGECAGTRIQPDNTPCPDCKFVWDVLIKAGVSPPAQVSTTRAREPSRWACPHCSGRNVQVSMPTWYYEATGFDLTFVETDTEAEVMFWYCEDCQESDSGQPIDTLAPPSIADQWTDEEIAEIKARGPQGPLTINMIHAARGHARLGTLMHDARERVLTDAEKAELHTLMATRAYTPQLSPVPVRGDEPIDEAFHARELRGGT